MSFLDKQDFCSGFWNNYPTFGAEGTYKAKPIKGEGGNVEYRDGFSDPSERESPADRPQGLSI